METFGKKKKDYSKSKIYAIRNDVDDDIYIGATTQPLSKRFSCHKKDSQTTKCSSYKLYQKMNKIGVQHFYIELIEDFPCQNAEHLHKREGEIIREQGTLNTQIAGRNKYEYYKDNSDTIKSRVKLHKQNNEEHYKEYKHNWYQKNKDKIEEQRRFQIDCDCGATIKRGNYIRHERTKKHQTYLNSLQD